MLIDRLQTRDLFACHCTVTDSHIHCGILVTRCRAGNYSIKDLQTEQRYLVQLPQLSHHTAYNLSLPLLPQDHDQSHPATA